MPDREEPERGLSMGNMGRIPEMIRMDTKEGPFGEEEKEIIRHFVETIQQYCPKSFRGIMLTDEPTYEDMRFQVYSSLAFGVTRIGYFTFWQLFHESTGEVFMKAMVNYEPSEEKGYRVSEIYHAVKEVNEEILALDHGRFSIRLGVGEGIFAIPYKVSCCDKSASSSSLA